MAHVAATGGKGRCKLGGIDGAGFLKKNGHENQGLKKTQFLGSQDMVQFSVKPTRNAACLKDGALSQEGFDAHGNLVNSFH